MILSAIFFGPAILSRPARAAVTDLSGPHYHVAVEADARRFSREDLEDITALILDHLLVGPDHPFEGRLEVSYTSPLSVQVKISPPFEGVSGHRLVKGTHRWINPEAVHNPRGDTPAGLDRHQIQARIPVVNIDACPNRMINDVIAFVRSLSLEGRIKSITVMPRTPHPGKSCYDESEYLIFLEPADYTVLMDGYQVSRSRNNHQLYAGPAEPEIFADLRRDHPQFPLARHFDEPGFAVVKMRHGHMTLTRRKQMVSLKVIVTGPFQLTESDIDAIVEVTKQQLGTSPDNPLTGDMKIRVKNPEGVDVIINENSFPYKGLTLIRTHTGWTLADPPAASDGYNWEL